MITVWKDAYNRWNYQVVVPGRYGDRIVESTGFDPDTSVTRRGAIRKARRIKHRMTYNPKREIVER